MSRVESTTGVHRAEAAMRVIIGMDEAGYGPNLGPLVVTTTAWGVEPGEPASLWERLNGVVRRAEGRVSRNGASDEDTLLLVDDSKKVYNSGSGLHELERSVLSFLAMLAGNGTTATERWPSVAPLLVPSSVEGVLTWLGAGERGSAVPSSDGAATTLPRVCHRDEVSQGAAQLQSRLARSGVKLLAIQSDLVDAPRFNRMLAEHDNKAAVLWEVSVRLLRRTIERLPAERVEVIADQQGGRRFYQAALQQAFPEHLVLCRGENSTGSRYSFRFDRATVEVHFRPRAEEELPVALASMVSKYLRELAMQRLNAFWREHLPTLQPTAGYPTDARRFWREIEPVAGRLGIRREEVWRAR